MPFFTFTFREQIYQAQYHVLEELPVRRFQVTDLPQELDKLVLQDLIFVEKDGVVEVPEWELGEAVGYGLRTEMIQLNRSIEKI